MTSFMTSAGLESCIIIIIILMSDFQGSDSWIDYIES